MPTKAELQATINDLTKQLKTTKDNVEHYRVLAQERHEKIKEHAAQITKQVDDKTLETKDETIKRLNEKIKYLEEKNLEWKQTRDSEVERLTKELSQLKEDWAELHNKFISTSKERDELKEDLEVLRKLNDILMNENKHHPTDVEVKMRNKLRREKKYYEDLLAEKIKENTLIRETCKTLGDQINKANEVAPTSRPAQAESIVSTPQKIWKEGDIHPTKGKAPKVPDGFRLAQSDEHLSILDMVYTKEQDKWNNLAVPSIDALLLQNPKYWYAKPTKKKHPLVDQPKQSQFVEVKSDWGVAPPQPKDPEWFNPDKAEYYPQPTFLQEFQQDPPEDLEDIDPTDLHTAVAERRQKFATGAVRSSDAANVRYDLLSPVGMRRLAETYKEGSVKYGDNNWQKGFPMSDVMNHAIRHLFLWLDGDKTEDHLAHATWNLITLMHFEERNPECNDVASRNSKH